MGWDITAWVEVHMDWMDGIEDIPSVELWYPIMDANLLLDRSYDAFGCLFGAANHANFEPVAAGRGLPPNVSKRVSDDAKQDDEADPGCGFVWPSWVTLAELEQVDWDEPALHADQRLHQYIRDAAGEWQYDGKAVWSGAFGRATGQSIPEALSGHAAPWTEGQEWLIGDRLYRAVRLKRRDALGEDWLSLFAIMRELGKRFKPEGVRLVVWFSF